jgi:enoyl-[acyl-carrier protein] reductase II
VAAGGIADGRGLAAALVLGAQAANIGTRFLVSSEAPISDDWKQAILAAESQEAIKVKFWNDIFPVSGQYYQTIPRTLSSPFIEEWQNQRDVVKQEAKRLQGEVVFAIEHGRLGELFPFTGQAAGLIKDILPAGEIVHRLVDKAEASLMQIAHLFK